MVFTWKFLGSGSVKKYGVLTWAVINFSSGTEIQTRLQESVKKPGQELVMFASEWELRKGHYDAVASFNFSMRDGMACINPHRGELEILNSQRANVEAISKRLTLSQSSDVYMDAISARSEY
jgi:hypothetical protein